MMHRLSLMNISLFTTMIAFNLTPSSLLSKNGVSLRNPSLSYQRWFYFCLFLLEQFKSRGIFLCGHSAGISTCASRRAGALCQPRGFRRLLHAGGLFRSLHGQFLSCFVLLILALNIPLYLLCIFLPCPRSTPALEFPIRLTAIGTLVLAGVISVKGSVSIKNIHFGICISAPEASRTASGCSLLSGAP